MNHFDSPFSRPPLGQQGSEVYYNPANGSLGSGPTYGESSFNYQPNLHGQVSSFFDQPGSGHHRDMPYDPFNPPSLNPQGFR